MTSPDADIHPVATGGAFKIVSTHQDPQDLVLYSGWFCPFVQRVWIALEEKKVPYQYKEENPYHKDAEFLKISPKGLVPAVTYHGKPFHESQVILEWLEDAFSDHKPNLRPSDAYDTAQMRIAVDHISKSIIPAFFRLLMSQEKEKQDEAREQFVKALNHFGAQVKGPWWGGETLSFADIVLAPFAARMFILEQHRDLKPELLSPEFNAWKERILERPSVANTMSELKYYEQIHGRYLRDEAQSEMAKGTRSGTGEP